jgi:UDP-N-acetyl-D-glucosamine dehydrogenase
LIELKAKLQSRNATAAVIGLGYVGLPLAMEIAAAGFRVIGIDLDEKKIRPAQSGKVLHPRCIRKDGCRRLSPGQKFTATTNFAALG